MQVRGNCGMWDLRALGKREPEDGGFASCGQEVV